MIFRDIEISSSACVRRSTVPTLVETETSEQRRHRRRASPRGRRRWDFAQLLAGAGGLGGRLPNSLFQKTGLALAGFHEYLKPGRVLIFGASEIRYPRSLDSAPARSLPARIGAYFPCVLVTGDFTPPPSWRPRPARRLPLASSGGHQARDCKALVARRSAGGGDLIHAPSGSTSSALELIVGASGIGKSLRLDLIVRCHRLVADDTVELRRRQETKLIGTCPADAISRRSYASSVATMTNELFGIAPPTRSSKRPTRRWFQRWDSRREYERLPSMTFSTSLGSRVPLIQMPVSPGRNVVSCRSGGQKPVGASSAATTRRARHADRLDRTLRDGTPRSRKKTRSKAYGAAVTAVGAKAGKPAYRGSRVPKPSWRHKAISRRQQAPSTMQRRSRLSS